MYILVGIENRKADGQNRFLSWDSDLGRKIQ